MRVFYKEPDIESKEIEVGGEILRYLTAKDLSHMIETEIIGTTVQGGVVESMDKVLLPSGTELGFYPEEECNYKKELGFLWVGGIRFVRIAKTAGVATGKASDLSEHRKRIGFKKKPAGDTDNTKPASKPPKKTPRVPKKLLKQKEKPVIENSYLKSEDSKLKMGKNRISLRQFIVGGVAICVAVGVFLFFVGFVTKNIESYAAGSGIESTVSENEPAAENTLSEQQKQQADALREDVEKGLFDLSLDEISMQLPDEVSDKDVMVFPNNSNKHLMVSVYSATDASVLYESSLIGLSGSAEWDLSAMGFTEDQDVYVSIEAYDMDSLDYTYFTVEKKLVHIRHAE